MDNDQAGIFLLIVAAAAAVYFLGNSNSSSGGTVGGADTDVSGGDLGSAFGDLDNLMDAPNSNNRAAFLAMIGQSEVGQALINETDAGYNVLVGSTAGNPLTFDDYSTHPDILNSALDSTAAGLYQINFPTFKTVSAQTGLYDFSPATQDAMAIQLITNKGALSDVDAGNFASAVSKCSGVWASLPGNTYGQPTNALAKLQTWFENAGGVIA